jgi:hypothetical protein
LLGPRFPHGSGDRFTSGEPPRSYVKVLKAKDAPREVAYATLLGFLDETFRADLPDLLVKEKPLSLGAFASVNSSGANVRLTYGLHACVEAMCSRYRIRWHEESTDTVRKHFTGKSRYPSRDEAKAAVVARCHLLGYLPRDCHDDDRADACAIFDWAASQHRRPEALHLFGEAPAPFVSIGDAAAAVVRKVRRGRAA